MHSVVIGKLRQYEAARIGSARMPGEDSATRPAAPCTVWRHSTRWIVQNSPIRAITSEAG